MNEEFLQETAMDTWNIAKKKLKTCTVFQDQPALPTEILTLGRKRL